MYEDILYFQNQVELPSKRIYTQFSVFMICKDYQEHVLIFIKTRTLMSSSIFIASFRIYIIIKLLNDYDYS